MQADSWNGTACGFYLASEVAVPPKMPWRSWGLVQPKLKKKMDFLSCRISDESYNATKSTLVRWDAVFFLADAQAASCR